MEQIEEQKQEKKERVNRCIEKIKQLLVEENCVLQPSITILGNGKVSGQMLIIAQDLVQIQSEEETKEEIENG